MSLGEQTENSYTGFHKQTNTHELHYLTVKKRAGYLQSNFPTSIRAGHKADLKVLDAI